MGPGNLFADIIKSKIVPVTRLTQVHRQAAQSNIVKVAHQLNAGNYPEMKKVLQGENEVVLLEEKVGC